MKFDLNEKRFKFKKIKSCNEKEVCDLDNISIKLLNYPLYDNLEKYIPELVLATWTENLEDTIEINVNDKNEIMKLFFEGKLIPTAQKSVQITFLIKGLTTHDVTHLLRHSGLSFAADCTGDKYINDRKLVIPSFLYDAPKEYKDRYVKLMKETYELYDDVCNNLTTKVHIQDARLILPRELETFYYVTGSLFDIIRFLNQRIDMQVQPKSDNVLALKLYKELKKVYPMLNIDINHKNTFYCNESKHQLSSKWYKPLKQNETEYTLSMDTVYGDMTEMYGYNKYKEIENKIVGEINENSSN